MRKSLVIARKELRDLSRDPVILALLGFLATASLLSLAVASNDMKIQIAEYNSYVSQLAMSGVTNPPPVVEFFPLQLMRGGVEYLEILGALFALLSGYGVIAKEKSRGTLDLILTRPLGAAAYASGKIIGLSVFWCVIVIALNLATVIELMVIGGAQLDALDVTKIALAAVFSWINLMIWATVGVAMTSYFGRPQTALVLSIALWLMIVLIIPQIGDTMDPDNQVPGGLFAALSIVKADELQVLAQFATYDTIRNGLEVSSVSKLFERITFALLGIKDKYNLQSIALIWADMWGYACALSSVLAVTISLSLSAHIRNTSPRRK